MTTNKAPIVEDLNIFSSSEEDKILFEPVIHFGKMPIIRTTRDLAGAFNHWSKIPDKRLEGIIQIGQGFRALALIYIRKQYFTNGVHTSHNIYGISHTLGAVTTATFTIMREVKKLEHPEGLKILTEHMLIEERGQGMDVYWRDNGICPTEMEYKSMAEQKNGAFISLITNLMDLFSTRKGNCQELINILGLYFEIRDDYLNLCDKTYHDEKIYCKDVMNGKFSFPIIHAISRRPDDTRIIDILKQRPTDTDTKDKCVRLLKEFGSLDYTKNELNNLDESARCEIERLGGNPYLEKILDSWKEIINSDASRETTKADM